MNTDTTEQTIPTTPTTPATPTNSIILNNNTETIENVMRDLEQKVNPKNIEEGIVLLVNAINNNDHSILLAPMQSGAKEFEERVGRPMTYSEMREMWG